MNQRKFQVFISSTFTDLQDERKAAVEAILSAGHIPAGMEDFAAEDKSQWEVIKQWIDSSDIYLLIVGDRYGSVDKETNKSYTQLEYEYAFNKGIPAFALVMSEQANDKKLRKKGKVVTETKYVNEFNDFKSLVLSRLVRFCDDLKDIHIQIHKTLNHFAATRNIAGWVRSDQVGNTVLLADQIAELSKENTALRETLKSLQENQGSYNGLSFNDMLSLLLTSSVLFKNEKITLDDYMIALGESLATKGVYKNGEAEGLYQLKKFGIAEAGLSGAWKFTEEGKKFYLKCLAMKPTAYTALRNQLLLDSQKDQFFITQDQLFNQSQ